MSDKLISIVEIIVAPFIPIVLTPVTMIPAIFVTSKIIGFKCRYDSSELCGFGEGMVVTWIMNCIVGTGLVIFYFLKTRKALPVGKKIF